MDFHVFRENSHDRLVKDGSKHRSLYFIRSPPTFFTTRTKHVYRGASESAPAIGTICKSGPRFCIKLEDEQVVLITNKTNSKSIFEFDGKEFVWETDRDLYEFETGKLLATFNRTGFGVKKMGILSVFGDGRDMLDIVVLTAIVVQYQWEEVRRKA